MGAEFAAGSEFGTGSTALYVIALLASVIIVLIALLLRNQMRTNTLSRRLAKAESKWESLIDGSNDYIAVFDANGMVLFFNNVLPGVVADTSSECTIYDLVPADQKALLAEVVSSVYESGLPDGYETKLLSERGEESWFSIRISNKGSKDCDEYQFIASDITKRVRAESYIVELAAKREELERIINHSHAIAVLWNAGDTWPIEYVTDNIQNFGFTADDFTSGKVTTLDIVYPDDVPLLMDMLDQHNTDVDSDGFHFEIRIVTKSGQIRWTNIRIWIKRGESSRPTHYYGVVMDITDRKRTEEALRENEARLSTILNTAADGIITISDVGLLETMNYAAELMFGVSKRSMVGKHITSLMPAASVATPDSSFEQFWRQPAHHNLRKPMEVVGRHADGMAIPLELSVSNALIGGRVIYTGILRDTSELKKLNELHQETQSIALLGGWELEVASGAMSFATQLCKLLDLPEGAELSLAETLSFSHPDYLYELSATFEECLQTGEPWVSEVKLISSEGRELWAKMIGRGYFRNGLLYRLAGTVQDITARKAVEEEKHVLEKQLRQSQKMEAIGQLTGGIAHDFNNMLASIMGYTGLALDRFGKNGEPKLKEYLDQVYKAGERARDLISKMLTFSRSGDSEPKEVEIRPLLEETITLLQPSLPSSVEMHVEYGDELPLVRIDPLQFEQMVMNLCINARDAMDGVGGIIIQLKLSTVSDLSCDASAEIISGEFVELSVADTGVGMSQEDVNRIFEPFFTTKDVGKGTGMGLAMVHGIMSEHGGHIVVDTEVSRGTVFRLFFNPIQEPTIVAHVADAEEPASAKNIRDGHVLIVDDDPAVGNYIGEVLEGLGLGVTVENNAYAALHLFERDPDKYDLVITDQTMPQMTGQNLAKTILALQPEQKIIVCTGYSDKIDEKLALELGFAGYLSKPVDVNEFTTLISSVLQGVDVSVSEERQATID